MRGVRPWLHSPHGSILWKDATKVHHGLRTTIGGNCQNSKCPDYGKCGGENLSVIVITMGRISSVASPVLQAGLASDLRRSSDSPVRAIRCRSPRQSVGNCSARPRSRATAWDNMPAARSARGHPSARRSGCRRCRRPLRLASVDGAGLVRYANRFKTAVSVLDGSTSCATLHFLDVRFTHPTGYE